MTAARGGSLGAVKALISRGAEVNAAEPSHGQTALMWAVSQRHADVAQTLIENRADVRARSITRHRTIQTGNRYGDQNSIKGSVGETDLAGLRRCCSRRGPATSRQRGSLLSRRCAD